MKMSPHTCTETIHWSSDTCKGSLDEGGGEGGGGGADAKPSSTPPRAREPRTKRHRREWGDAAQQGVSRKETSELHAGLVKLGQQLALWMEKLVNAHEKCRAIPSNPVIRLSIFIFTNLMVVREDNDGRQNNLYRHVGGYRALAASTFWMAIKFIAPRQALPSASFMSYITGVDKRDLIEVEIAALEGIRWDVYHIARQAGLATIDTE